MLADAYYSLSGFFAQGGNVLWLIAGLTFLLWTLVFERWWYFRTEHKNCLLYTSPSPRDATLSRMPSSA